MIGTRGKVYQVSGWRYMIKDKIKNVSAFAIGPIVGAVFSFITVPIITHFISPAEYGRTSMFVLTQSMLTLIIFLGFDQAYVREYHEHKDEKEKLLFNAMVLPYLITFFLEIVMFFFADYISLLLFDTTDQKKCVFYLMILLPFTIVENFSLLKVRMEEKGIIYSSFIIIQKALILVLTILFFSIYSKTFESVILGAVIAEIINAIIMILTILKPKLYSIDHKMIRKMMKFGIPLIFSSIIGLVLSSTDKIMLRTLCTYKELGLYSSAFKIVSVLSIIQQCFTLVWTPVAYRWYAEKRKNEDYSFVGNIVSTVMTMLCLGVLLCKELVAILLGSTYREAIYIMPFLLIYPIMYTVSEVTSLGISFSRKTIYNIIISATCGVINIIINYFLIPIYGGKGAALATGISYVVFFIMRTLISRKLWWKFSVTKYMYNLIIIVINCLIHTSFNGIVPYIISICSFILIGITSIKDIKNIVLKFKTEKIV